MSPNATPDNPEKPDVIQRAKNGAQEAFLELVIDHEQVIRSIVRSFIRNLAGYEEDDVVHEVVLHAYNTIAEFHGDEKAFQYFLRRTARGLCLNIIKKYRKAEYQELEEGKDYTNGISGRPDTTYITAEIQECVHQAIRLLPATLREVVILSDIEELDYKEIAEILGVPIGTIKSRLNRAREQLKKFMQALHCVEML